MEAVQYVNSPIGLLCLRSDGDALFEVSRTERRGEDRPDPVTRAAARELEEYFSQKRKKFSGKLSPRGTPFQRLVWAELTRIPYGARITYGQLAARIGRPAACRAVGSAVGKNPLLIFVPCHRVVAAHGLGGFSAGLDAKRTLLRLEGTELGQKDELF